MKSSDRKGATVRLLAVHTGEGARTARNMVAFFEKPDAEGSAHAIIDHAEALAGVPYDRAAWTLRSGNAISENVELCAFAEMTRAQWLSEESVTWRHTGLKRDVTVDDPRQMLRRLSVWLAERSRVRKIPLRKLTPTQVRAGESGVIGHNDWTVGMADGSHWDPGPGFPWDVVIGDAQAINNGGTNLMTFTDEVVKALNDGAIDAGFDKDTPFLRAGIRGWAKWLGVWTKEWNRGASERGYANVATYVSTQDVRTAAIVEVQKAHGSALAEILDWIRAHAAGEGSNATTPGTPLAVSHDQLVAALSDPRTVTALARALSVENDRRARDGDPTTGPTT